MTLENRIANALQEWHQIHREEHFFRQNRTPYRVWISEVALQQTRIGAAAAPLANFLEAFPDIDSLARAEERQVLEAFRGLGYYNRARNIHKAARLYRTGLPETYETLLKVPSIGPYTAAAIASICFQEKVPVIDGNIKRIAARLLALNESVESEPFLRLCRGFMEKLIQYSENPGFLNEAAMELGQKICLPKTPLCQNCPVQNRCQAHARGLTTELPRKKERPKWIPVEWQILIPQLPDGKILLEKNEKSDFPFLKNHICLPSRARRNGNEYYTPWALNHKEKFTKEEEFQPGPAHTITRHKIRFSYRTVRVKEGLFDNENGDTISLCVADIGERLVSSGLQKVWKLSGISK